MFKWLLKWIKAPTIVTLSGFKEISKLGVGLAATTQEGNDTASRRDPTGPKENNE